MVACESFSPKWHTGQRNHIQSHKCSPCHQRLQACYFTISLFHNNMQCFPHPATRDTRCKCSFFRGMDWIDVLLALGFLQHRLDNMASTRSTWYNHVSVLNARSPDKSTLTSIPIALIFRISIVAAGWFLQSISRIGRLQLQPIPNYRHRKEGEQHCEIGSTAIRT